MAQRWRERWWRRAVLGAGVVAALGTTGACGDEAPAAQPPVTVTIETTTIPTTPPSAAPVQSTTTTVAGVAYVVVSGDTVSDIAARFGVTVAAVVAANSITDPRVLSVGQTLIIPGAQGVPTTIAGAVPTTTPGSVPSTTGAVA